MNFTNQTPFPVEGKVEADSSFTEPQAREQNRSTNSPQAMSLVFVQHETRDYPKAHSVNAYNGQEEQHKKEVESNCNYLSSSKGSDGDSSENTSFCKASSIDCSHFSPWISLHLVISCLKKAMMSVRADM